MFGSLLLLAQIALTPGFSSDHYYYMTRGDQVKVYRSKDFTTCLKLIDPQPCKESGYISFKGALKQMKKRRAEEKKAYKSYKIAFDSLRDETGIREIHLKREKCYKKPLWTLDEKGRVEFIDLNKTPFILQEWTLPFDEALESALKTSQTEAENLLTEAFDIMESLLKKGYLLKDPNLLKNWGVAANGPLIVDLGQFCEIPSKRPAYRIEKMFAKSVFKLVMRYPQLSDHVGHLIRAKSAWWSESASSGSSPS